MTKQKVSRKRNPVAKDLRTPKYRMRVTVSKLAFKRKPKHVKFLTIESE